MHKGEFCTGQMVSKLMSGRTHRERKETYIKGLELEVCRLKEEYTKLAITCHRPQTDGNDIQIIKRENELLKRLLDMHGITYDLKPQIATPPPSTGQLSVGQPSLSPSHNHSFSQPSRQQRPSDIDFNSTPYRMGSASEASHNTNNNSIDMDNSALASGNAYPHFPNGNMSPASSAISSHSQGSLGFHSQSHSSTNGSSFAPTGLTPSSNTARSSPIYPASQQPTDPDTIDSILEESNTPTYEPGYYHGAPNGNGVGHHSQDGVITPIAEHDQSAVDFILAYVLLLCCISNFPFLLPLAGSLALSAHDAFFPHPTLSPLPMPINSVSINEKHSL